MSKIFDTHAHYDDSAFHEDRKELLSGLFRHGVGNVVNAGAAARELPRILRLTEQYDFLYGAAGLHPCETYSCGDNTGEPVMHLTDLDGQAFAEVWKDKGGEYSAILAALDQYRADEIITSGWRAGDREMKLLRAVLDMPKIVAVGEIGLDYHYEDTQKEVQQEWFVHQIALAKEKHLPIIVHSRDAAADTYEIIHAGYGEQSRCQGTDSLHSTNAGYNLQESRQAMAETLDIIQAEQARDVGGIIHCFSYGKEMARQFLDLGFMIGIGGVVTYKNAKKVKEVVTYMPMDRLVLETDCPYLAPSPNRGKRNDSSLIQYVAQAIAEIKGLSAEEVIAITEQNARRVYRLPE